MKRNLVVLLAMVMAVFVTASPAAADDEMGISSDGVTFTPNFHGPLFDSDLRWVPGDFRQATFYVRNQGGTPARLSIDILGNHVGDLLDSGDITIEASAGGKSGSVSDGAERRLLTLPKVADGQVVPVTVSVNFDFSSPNDTQVRSTDFRFRINLSQASAVVGEDDGNGLPDTGGLALWMAVFGSILLGTGVAIVSRRRHNPLGDSHV